MATTDKANTISSAPLLTTPTNFGERVASTNSDAPASPSEDQGDLWAADPWTSNTVGAADNSESHNSGGDSGLVSTA